MSEHVHKCKICPAKYPHLKAGGQWRHQCECGAIQSAETGEWIELKPVSAARVIKDEV